MSTEEIVINETLSGRIFKQPRVLTLTAEGLLRVPDGTAFDFSPASFVVLPNNLRQEIRDEILALVAGTVLTGNIVHFGLTNTATDSNSSVILASDNSQVTGNAGLSDATEDGVFCSTNCSITGNNDNSSIISSTGSTIAGGSGVGIARAGIHSSQNSNITNSGSVAMQGPQIMSSVTGSILQSGTFIASRSIIDSCNNSTITATNANALESAIIATVTGTIDSSSRSMVGCCSAANITGPCDFSGIFASVSCSVTNSLPSTQANSNAIIGSNTCQINNTVTGNNVARNAILGSTGCQINGTLAVVRNNNIGGSQSCILDSCSDSSAASVSSGSATTANNCFMVASTNPVITSCNSCLVGGTAPTCTGRTNSLVWGNASPTANNQAVLGVDTRITGSGSNLRVESGYINPSRGLVSPIRLTNGSTTLSIGDQTIFFNAGAAGTVTLPQASTFGANYPLDTVTEFKINTPIGNVVNSIITTGADRLNQLSFFNSYTIPTGGREIIVELLNFTVSPRWRLKGPTRINYTTTCSDNNFGTGALPKSDANQLPTSTSQANHQTLTTTAYWSMNGAVLGDSTALFFTNTVTPTNPPGIVTNARGVYTVIAQFDIVTGATPVGSYRIRADVRRSSDGATLPGGYIDVSGTNDVDGTRHVVIACGPTVLDAAETVTLRMSQDSVSTIAATANIRNVTMQLTAFI